MKRNEQSNGKPSQAGDDNFARPHDGSTFGDVFEAAPATDPGDHPHHQPIQHQHDPSIYGQGAAMAGGALPPQPGQEYASYRHGPPGHAPPGPPDYSQHTGAPPGVPGPGPDPATDYRYGVPVGTPARQDHPHHATHLEQQAAAVAAGVGAPGAAQPPASPAVYRPGTAHTPGAPAPPPGGIPQHPGASAWHPASTSAAHAQHPQHLQPHVPQAAPSALMRPGVPPGPYDAAHAQAQYQANAAAGAAAAQYPPRERQPSYPAAGAGAGYPYYNYPPPARHQAPAPPTAPRYGAYGAAAAGSYPGIYAQGGYYPQDPAAAYPSRPAPGQQQPPYRMGSAGVLPPGAAGGVGPPGQPGMVPYGQPYAPPNSNHYIRSTNANDVLCGRGGATNSHAGNRAFRKLVKQFKDKYLRAKKKEKPNVAAEVVEIIRGLDPSGRFLKKDKETGFWVDIGDARAKEKTSQALREGAPAIRKKLNDLKEEEERHRDRDLGAESDDISSRSSPEKFPKQEEKPQVGEGEGDRKVPAVEKSETVSAFSPLQESIGTGTAVKSESGGSDTKKADNSDKGKSASEDDRKPAPDDEANSRKRPSPTRAVEGESPQKRAKDELSEKEKNLYDVFDPPRHPLRNDGSDDDDKDKDEDKKPVGEHAEI